MNRLGTHFQRRLINYLTLAAALLLLGGGGFAAFESDQVSNYAEGVWWALSLLSGSGFVGEIPTSLVGRLVAAVLMVSGFALFTLVTASVSSLFVREEQEPELRAEGRFERNALRLLADISDRVAALEAAPGRVAGTGDPGPPPRDPG